MGGYCMRVCVIVPLIGKQFTAYIEGRFVWAVALC